MTTRRPHIFMYDEDGLGCRHCPLPRRNRVHDLPEVSVPDITEPTRAAGEPPRQLPLPKPRKAPRARRRATA